MRPLATGLLVICAALSPLAASPSGAEAAAGPAGDPGGSTWQLATSSARDAAGAPAYVGNGYVGTRVPASGAGYADGPVATETHVAGVYADVPDTVAGGTQHQGSVNLPGWTQLDVVAGGRTLDAADGTGYHQVLDLRRGTVTTSATVASGGRRTALRYQVLLDRAHPRTGLVSLVVRPGWSGVLRVRDVLGAGARLTPGALSAVRATATRSLSELTVRAKGTGTLVSEAARLHAPARSRVTAAASGMTVRRTAMLRVRAGHTYRFTKVVGFATSEDAGSPTAVARRWSGVSPQQAQRGSAAAWAREWRHDVLVPGQPELQRRIRAAEFYLLASVRPDVDWSVSPVGLSAGGYNDHVFWDAETWMYPALLAQHPDDASSVVDYRYRTRAGAARNAESTGYDGLRFAWESARTGDEVTPTWAETGHLEQHVTADVALAQWQYYLATGDRAWLRTRGWPVLRGAAEFWASRAEQDGSSYHITGVEGPDEENWPVDDEVYTNATAATTLRLATRAAGVLGRSAPASWATIADGLVVQPPQALGGYDQVRPEFRDYAEQQVKQADAVLLTYPWELDQPDAVDRDDLDYYAEHYDPDGPAMTDSVNSIVAAQLGQGCADWTYTRRSVDPFVKAPYEQFTEARSGQGVFTFLTGEGGFLQEFLYGYSGLRWRADGIVLDPTLPPALSRGLRLTGLQWQGRTVDVDLGAEQTVVTMSSGAPMRVHAPDGTRRLAVGAPVTLATRQPHVGSADLALCRPVTAHVTTADPSAPPEAAVDGSPATVWGPASDPATPSSLTVELAGRRSVSHAVLVWRTRPLATYAVQVHHAGAWRTVAHVASTASDTDDVSFAPVTADAVRLRLPPTRRGGDNPLLAELRVTR
ncbi:discoidin domain-containing protein [Nocardioides sp.]|uniref:galactose-binding domain-containing protein n=1 Tax=Nocardioides sp. TaxID=35761 RepID=UPI003783ECDA